MKHTIKLIIVLMLTCAAAFSGGTAYAKEIALPSGFIIADGDGVHASKDDGGYMISVSGIHPGDVITKTINLQHFEESSYAYDLYLTAEPVGVTGPVDLIEHSCMILQLDGKTVYNGPVQGTANGILQSDALDLGRYSYGDRKILNVIIKIDEDWEIGYTQSMATYRWNFQAVKDKQQAESPKTGDIIRYILYILCALMIIAVCVLYIIYKKKEKRYRHSR